jgi:outer membrane protein assembly factor BamB
MRYRVLLSAILLCIFFGAGDRRIAADQLSIAQFPKLSAQHDWPWWRGPSRNGIADSTSAPVKFSDNGGYAWKAPVPGRGHSSPIVVGDEVFLTTADEKQQVQSVLAFDRGDGKLLWSTPVSRGGFPAKNHAKNTEATPTVACDGERVIASFFHHKAIHVTALDLKGKKLWQISAGAFDPKKYEYGYAPSPVIYGKTVIVSAEHDGKSFIAAFDRKTGDEVWRTPRPTNITFSSPVVAMMAGKEQLLLSGTDQVASYSPESGKQLWTAPGTTTATCGTVVWEGDVVFASGGYPGSETIAIRADGSREAVWKNSQRLYEQSLLAHNGYLYGLTGQGILFCWRTSDGREMWKQRLKGPVSASPVLAGDNIYWANELGTIYVFKANAEKFELVAENQVGTDSFPSPAICAGQVFLRVGHTTDDSRQEYLYCFEG